MAIFDDPRMLLSLIGLVVDIVLLALLYSLLPGTAKTGHVRYILRFGIIWAIGNLGLGWSLLAGSGYELIRIVSEVVLLLGMVPMTAFWTHLAWLTVLDLKEKDKVKTLDNYQIIVYVVAIVWIFVGFMTRKGVDLMPRPYMTALQVWFIVCMIWSTMRFLGSSFDDSPAIEKRSRVLLAAGSVTMFLLLLIDVLQAVTGGSDLAVASGLEFIPMALVSCGFLLKRRFIIAPVICVTGKGTAALGLGVHLPPGKMYFEPSKPSDDSTGMDILKAQARRGRPSLVITDKDPKAYRAKRWIGAVPVVRFVSEKWDDDNGLDVTSNESLAMVPVMVKDFALESWEINKDKTMGSFVLIDGAHVLARVAPKGGTKALLKGLAKAVKGSDQLRIVIIGDRSALGKRNAIMDRYAVPLSGP